MEADYLQIVSYYKGESECYLKLNRLGPAQFTLEKGIELLQKECGMEQAMKVEEDSGEIEKFWVDCVLLKSEVGYDRQ